MFSMFENFYSLQSQKVVYIFLLAVMGWIESSQFQNVFLCLDSLLLVVTPKVLSCVFNKILSIYKLLEILVSFFNIKIRHRCCIFDRVHICLPFTLISFLFPHHFFLCFRPSFQDYLPSFWSVSFRSSLEEGILGISF